MKLFCVSVTLILVLAWFSVCSAGGAECDGDLNGDNVVSINEIITGVNNGLNGCPPPPPRFIDNGDGTITDNQTGLTWEKKVALDGSSEASDLHDADNLYSFSGVCTEDETVQCQPNAAAAGACRTGERFCDRCSATQGICSLPPLAITTIFDWVVQLSASGFAGYTDWRVPSIAELETLRDPAKLDPSAFSSFHDDGCSGNCTDPASSACSCTNSTGYWSSTTATVDTLAWRMDFGDGSVFSTDAFQASAVRAVRGKMRTLSP